MEKLEWTGERYVPWADDFNTAYEHLHRYQFAKEFVDGKRVLDLASGEGYGSFILAATAESVTGVDIDDLSVRHASAKYVRDNLSFLKGSITSVPIEGERLFDVVVCFEAIEHVEEHEALLHEVKRLMTDDGLFIVSSPNKRIYSDIASYANPFHVKELYFEEFRDLLLNNFSNSYFYGQKVYPASSIFPLFEGSELSRDYVIEMGGNKEFVFLTPEQRVARYFVAVATNATVPVKKLINHSVLLDQSESLIRQCNARIGRFKDTLQQKDDQLAKQRQDLESLQQKLEFVEKEFKKNSEERERRIEENTAAVIRLTQKIILERQRFEEYLAQSDEQLLQGVAVINNQEEVLQIEVDGLETIRKELACLLEAESANRERYVQQLQEKEHQIKDKEQRINDLLNSISWKITAPLRMLGRKIRLN